MAKYLFFVESRFVGEFDSPLFDSYDAQYKLAPLHICRYCSEFFARRLPCSGKPLFYTIYGCCRSCLKAGHPAQDETLFRLIGEVDLGFAPIELLAEEFLFNSENLRYENHDSRA